MGITCKVCKNKIEDLQLIRCPRCQSILREPPKCGDCKGCGLGKKSCSK